MLLLAAGLGRSVADIPPAPPKPRPDSHVTAVIGGIREGRENSEPVPEESVVPEGKSVPKGKAIGPKAGMDRGETSEAGTGESSAVAKSAAGKAHMAKSATAKSAMAKSTMAKSTMAKSAAHSCRRV